MFKVLFGASAAYAAVINFEEVGGIAGNFTLEAANHNGGLLNTTLNALGPGDTFVIPNKTFHTMGGIIVETELNHVTIQLDGTLDFSSATHHWPRTGPGKKGRVLDCLQFPNGVNHVLFTSSGAGTMQGNGKAWWGVPGVGYLLRQENRPRLFHIYGSSRNITLENWFFKNSPYWTCTISGVHGLEIRNSHIDTKRNPKADGHGTIELTAFNTDGFDLLEGSDIWIHHCTVWNQDDTFCVKDETENVLIENCNASGVGLTIGSIASHVRNITFRNIYMHHTSKGIYMKFRDAGLIEDVLYENIIMDAPEQFPIWIGPAQQSDSVNLCAAHPCSICWPSVHLSKCNAPQNATYRNITLRNITINSPKMAAGVILANSGSPMENVVFENVVINHPSKKKKPWGTGYECVGVESGVATGSTNPVPSCFKDMTDATLAKQRWQQL